ncbi:MAG: helix-turn-helix transcriptional regulator [Loktanella sp.]|nr:helix-turn-helix transcriptional regulator [Loktanella sp.]
MNALQARLARAAVQMGVREIGALAGINPNTISRIENGADPKLSTVVALRKAYESLGVVFLDDGQVASGSGVSLKSD